MILFEGQDQNGDFCSLGSKLKVGEKFKRLTHTFASTIPNPALCNIGVKSTSFQGSTYINTGYFFIIYRINNENTKAFFSQVAKNSNLAEAGIILQPNIQFIITKIENIQIPVLHPRFLQHDPQINIVTAIHVDIK